MRVTRSPSLRIYPVLTIKQQKSRQAEVCRDFYLSGAKQFGQIGDLRPLIFILVFEPFFPFRA